MKLLDAISIITAAIFSGGKHLDSVQSIRQSSQLKASAAHFASNAASDLAVFEEAARHMREMS